VKRTILANDKDNVVTTVNQVEEGETFEYLFDGTLCTGKANDLIQFCHKIAITDVLKGDSVIKYGEIIGNASQDIKRGDYVHVHNLESNRGRGDKNKGGDF